jgi:hypothetical protein
MHTGRGDAIKIIVPPRLRCSTFREGKLQAGSPAEPALRRHANGALPQRVMPTKVGIHVCLIAATTNAERTPASKTTRQHQWR